MSFLKRLKAPEVVAQISSPSAHVHDQTQEAVF